MIPTEYYPEHVTSVRGDLSDGSTYSSSYGNHIGATKRAELFSSKGSLERLFVSLVVVTTAETSNNHNEANEHRATESKAQRSSKRRRAQS